ncbi:MAG: bifunctional hydroxymethylpyrimidine kinase/phosphomethylpyrimidine kinase [Christensenellales bacterium]
MKHALTIAGSDCSGGAGIQADLKTFAAHGVYGMSVIVSVVAENTERVISIEDISPKVICDQIDAVFTDIDVHAVKVGMLSGAEQMQAVAQRLSQYRPQNVVIDPVMVAKGGCALMQPEALDTMRRLILPLADILTPNLPEAEALSGMQIRSDKDMQKAAQAMMQMGAKSVVIKGGHLTGKESADVLFDGNSFLTFVSPRIDTKNTHGTGCTFSSAIAANLANGMARAEAVKAAKRYITGAIEHALPIGHGHGPTHHFYSLYKKGFEGMTR